MSKDIIFQESIRCDKCGNVVKIAVKADGIGIEGGTFLSRTGAIITCDECANIQAIPMVLHNTMILHLEGQIKEEGVAVAGEVAKVMALYADETGFDIGEATSVTCPGCSNEVTKRVIIEQELLVGGKFKDSEPVCLECEANLAKEFEKVEG